MRCELPSGLCTSPDFTALPGSRTGRQVQHRLEASGEDRQAPCRDVGVLTPHSEPTSRDHGHTQPTQRAAGLGGWLLAQSLGQGTQQLTGGPLREQEAHGDQRGGALSLGEEGVDTGHRVWGAAPEPASSPFLMAQALPPLSDGPSFAPIIFKKLMKIGRASCRERVSSPV